MKRLKYAQHVTRRTLSATKYTDLLKMNHILLQEITVQSIQKALCVQLHLNLSTQHRDVFCLSYSVWSSSGKYPHISFVWDARQKKTGLEHILLSQGLHFNICICIIFYENHSRRQNNQPKDF